MKLPINLLHKSFSTIHHWTPVKPNSKMWFDMIFHWETNSRLVIAGFRSPPTIEIVCFSIIFHKFCYFIIVLFLASLRVFVVIEIVAVGFGQRGLSKKRLFLWFLITKIWNFIMKIWGFLIYSIEKIFFFLFCFRMII